MVKDVVEWPWSSYRATVGLEHVPGFAHVSWVLEQFGGSRKRYRDYVGQELMTDAPLQDAGKRGRKRGHGKGVRS
ncbi:MAG: hypothetical protein Q9M27_04590 [Mariprofundaceae bacterium]|nr:hypothetical protein [Mariprofundaceae bacterium]